MRAAPALALVAFALGAKPVAAHGGVEHLLGHGWVATIIEIASVIGFAVFAGLSLYRRHK